MQRQGMTGAHKHSSAGSLAELRAAKGQRHPGRPRLQRAPAGEREHASECELRVHAVLVALEFGPSQHDAVDAASSPCAQCFVDHCYMHPCACAMAATLGCDRTTALVSRSSSSTGSWAPVRAHTELQIRGRPHQDAACTRNAPLHAEHEIGAGTHLVLDTEGAVRVVLRARHPAQVGQVVCGVCSDYCGLPCSCQVSSLDIAMASSLCNNRLQVPALPSFSVLI